MSQPSSTGVEEAVSAITHALGAALGIAALSVLVTLASVYGDVWRIVSFSIYGATLVLLYLASTSYHAAPRGKLKRALRVLDHSAIYLLIAGSYTPFTLVSLRGPWGWSLFSVIWTLAAVGVVFKACFATKYQALSSATYLFMGWMVIVGLKPTIENIPPPGLAWLVAGGLCYTIGVIFFAWRSLPHHHGIWHLFVLAGSACHYLAILFYVLPIPEY